jgi:O-antigen/teichoic acid export membrane protein
MMEPLGKLRAFLPEDRFLRNVGVIIGGTSLGQGIVILTSPLLTRLYTPENFGVLAVYASLLGIVVVVASLRYEVTITLPERDEDAANLLVLSLGILVLMSLLMGIVVGFLGDQIARLTGTPTLGPYLWLLPLGVMLAGLYQVFNYWAVRERAYTHIARTRLSQGIGQTLTQIALGFSRMGSVGLIAGQVAGQAAGSITLATLTRRKNKTSFKAVHLASVCRLAHRYRRFPILSSGTALLNSVGLFGPALLLAAFYGPQVAGWFALSQRVVGVPMTLLGKAVAQVYLGEFARAALHSDEQLSPLFWRTAKGLSIVGLLFVVLVTLPAPWLFPLVFGSEWAESGVYVQVLSLMFLLQFVVSPISATFDVLERQDLHLLREIARLTLISGSVSLPWVLGEGPLVAVVSLGVAGSVSYVFGGALAWYAIIQRKDAS